MNDHIMRAVEKAANEHSIVDILREPHRPIREVTDAVDAQDLAHQHKTFIHLLHIDTSTKADKLRHRAHMMRLRADEFDKLADDIEKQCDVTTNQSHGLLAVIEDIEMLLYTHAHIEPKRVG